MLLGPVHQRALRALVKLLVVGFGVLVGATTPAEADPPAFNIAFARDSGSDPSIASGVRLYVVATATGETRTHEVPTGGLGDFSFALSADGRRLLCSDDSGPAPGLKLFDISGPEFVDLGSYFWTQNDRIIRARLSGDGSRILYAREFPYMENGEPLEGSGSELEYLDAPAEGSLQGAARSFVSVDVVRETHPSCGGSCGFLDARQNHCISANGRFVGYAGQVGADIYVSDEDSHQTTKIEQANLLPVGFTPRWVEERPCLQVADNGTMVFNLAIEEDTGFASVLLPLGGPASIISHTQSVLDIAADGSRVLLRDTNTSPTEVIYLVAPVNDGVVGSGSVVYQHSIVEASWAKLSADGNVVGLLRSDTVNTTATVIDAGAGTVLSEVGNIPYQFGDHGSWVFDDSVFGFGGPPTNIVVTPSEPRDPRAGPGPTSCPDPTNVRSAASSSGLPGAAPGASGSEQASPPADPHAGSGRKSNPNGTDPCDDANCNKACSLTGDPVNLFRGSVVEQAVDVSWSTPGGHLIFQRTYNSDITRVGALGPGWSHSFERRIESVTGGAVEIDGRGVRAFFQSSGSAFLPMQGGGARLQRTSNGWISRYRTGTVYTYRDDGKLDQIQDPNGNITRAEYSASGDLERIIDPRGGVLAFEYSGSKIRELVAKDGQRTTFAYNGLGELAVVGHSATQLTQYTYAHGSAGEPLVSRITQPSGRYTAFIYDTQKRVTRLEEQDLSGGPGVTEIDYPSTLVRNFKDPGGEVTVYRYNDTGQLVERTDPDGLSVLSEFNAAGLLTRVTDRDGTVTIWTYSTDGELVSHRSPAGLVTQVVRDIVTGAPTLTTLPDGAMIQKQFDERGNLVRVVDPVGGQATSSIDASGLVTSVVDPLGRVTAFEHDANGDLTATIAPDGGRTTIARDSLGRAESITSPNGRVTQFEYQGVGLVRATVDAAGQRTTREFDADGLPTSITTPNGAHTTLEYRMVNGRNVVVSVTDTFGGVTRMFHDARGDLVRIEDPLHRETTFTRDILGRVSTITYPDGTGRSFTYTALGRVASVTNARGAAVTFSYDADSRITRIQAPDGTASLLSYDSAGRVATTTAPDGGASSRFYDSASRLVMAVDALGSISRTEYTSSGAVRRYIDRRDHATTFEQDQLDRTVKAIDALGNTSRSVYDQDGLLSQTFDARNAETRLTYDAQSRPTESLDALGNRIRKGYDAMGNCTSVTDQNGRVWTLEYDLLNRLTRRMDPNGRSVTYDYDVASQLKEITWEDGSRWSYIRDLMGRVLTRRLLRSDGSEEDRDQFTYDTVGNVLTSENAAVRVINVFDLMDRVTLRTTLYKATGSSRQQGFTYDAMGRRATMSDTQGRVVTYAYDRLSRLTGLTAVEAQPGAAGIQAAFRTRHYGFTYDRTGNLLEVTYPNGTRTKRDYDDANRMTRLAHERVTEAGVQTLASFDYLRDPNGNITQITDDQARVFRYTYDLNGRLTRALLPEALVQRLKQKDQAKANANVAQDPDDEAEEALIAAADVSYTYDPAGNLTLESRDGRAITSTFSPANEILTRDGITFSHDVRGNLIGKTLRNGARRAYAFDTAGRMTSYSRSTKLAPDTMLGVEAYTYDPIGRRATLQNLANQKFTHFLWDGAQLADEWKQVSVTATARNDDGIQYLIGAGGQPLEQYEYRRRKSLTYPDVTGTNGALPPTNLTWLHPDHLGSTALTTKVDAPSGSRQVYGPLGQELDGTFTSTRYGYAGMHRSAKSGLHYAWHRFYDPDAGRFVSRDPIHFAAGDTNLYRYAGNNPINWLDPLGLKKILTNSGFTIEDSSVDPTPYVGQPTDEPGDNTGPALIGLSLFGGPLGALIVKAYGAYQATIAVSTMAGDPTPQNVAAVVWMGAGAAALYAFNAMTRGLHASLNTPTDPTICARLGGQLHHPISRPVADALNKHPTLRGHYAPRDARFETRAVDRAAHNGYDAFGKGLDKRLIDWAEAHPNATPAQFEAELWRLYSEPAVRLRFPYGADGGR